MTLARKVASALSFAHLAGLGRAKPAASAEDDDPKKKDDPGATAEDEDPEKDDKEKKDPEAKAEDDDPAAAGGDPEKKDDEKDKAKGAVAAGDEDDDKDEMSGKSAAAQARLREQARCAAIFASAAAGRNPVLAANLAFNTRMTRCEARALLESTPAPAAAGHPGRAANNPRAAASPGNPPSHQQAVAARWDQHLQAAAKGGRR
jgi:hypothetical protein